MNISSEIIQINKPTAKDICFSIAQKVKSRRLELNYTQIGLASRADVNIETYRKFERTGEVSLFNLIKIAIAMDMTSEFDVLFAQHQYQNLNELLSKKNIKRKRGNKK